MQNDIGSGHKNCRYSFVLSSIPMQNDIGSGHRVVMASWINGSIPMQNDIGTARNQYYHNDKYIHDNKLYISDMLKKKEVG